MASFFHVLHLLFLCFFHVFAHQNQDHPMLSSLDFFRGFFGKSKNDTRHLDHHQKPTEKKPMKSQTFAYRGGWELASHNSGVSAMHLFILPNTNKAVMFDSVSYGPSEIRLQASDDCHHSLSYLKQVVQDCWAHAVEFDIDTGDVIRPLNFQTDTWSSSGGFSSNGTMVLVGGKSDGAKSVRYLFGCKNCQFEEYRSALIKDRWYSTQHILPDGRFIVVGGRRTFSYEYIPNDEIIHPKAFQLPFLRRTTDPVENNLYPFVFLSTDGNLFIFANSRSVLLNPSSNLIVRELPVLPGGSRNYPSSGSSALLPIRLDGSNLRAVQAHVLICGGAKTHATEYATNGIFVSALSDCGRIDIADPTAKWQMETMPSPRVMGQMLVLPTGDILIINGAKRGTSGRNFAHDPNLIPLLYKSSFAKTQRFMKLKATNIPRMYLSTAALLPDGKVLVAGGNPNYRYNFTGIKYPTELRVEKFHPPYLDPLHRHQRPLIISGFSRPLVTYGKKFDIWFKLKRSEINQSNIQVTMYAPPFTTHGLSMGQRLIILLVSGLIREESTGFRVTAVAPPSATIAPPGFYLVFVVNRGVPSHGVWMRFA